MESHWIASYDPPVAGLPEVSWQRYWRARDGNTTAAESAVLLDIGLVDQAGLVPTQRVASNLCTVLLAPPGAGKSYELRVLTGSWQGDAQRISLGGAGGPERLLSRIDEALRDLDTPGAMLALDSVDETSPRRGVAISARPEIGDRRWPVVRCGGLT